MMDGRELILASASAGRAAVLRGAGLSFRQVPAEINERAIEDAASRENGAISGEQVAMRLAAEKALAVSRLHPQALVLGADQVMSCGGRLFHKPTNLEAARRQLAELRGREHFLLAGLAVALGGELAWDHLGRASLTMREFSDVFLDDYIAAEGGDLLASVGSYRIEGRGIQLFSHVAGDHFTIIGLPLLPLLGYLRESGWLPS
jgi:septum formation protein